MSRFIGLQDNHIVIVSDHQFVSENFKVMKLPSSLEDVTNDELINNFIFNNSHIVRRNEKKKFKDCKIALVSNWKMKCGIATYAENIWSKVAFQAKEFKIFAEKNDNPTGLFDCIKNTDLFEHEIISCWERGKSLQNLVDEIKKYDPDIIWIQHEFGLFPHAGYWLSMLSQLSDYRIIVTMHSVFHHQDKTICEAAMPEIVTHQIGGLNVLKKEKQVPGKVYVIPHGCEPCTDKKKFWNYYKSEHTIIQAGFLFKYKGCEEALKAVALLKPKYPKVFFTGLCSESDFNKAEHQSYFEELCKLINHLKINDNVALIRGFQSEQTWDSYFRTNKIALFPYVSNPEHEVFGASGVARVAMGKALPVVTSYANHFADLPTIKADSPEEIAEEIDKLFSSSKLQKDQIDLQCKFLEENSWEKMAQKYVEIFES